MNDAADGWGCERRYDAPMTSPRSLPFPIELRAAGTADAPFEAAMPVSQLPPGSMARISRGDLDLLLAHTDDGIVATEDRCPHMSAPFSEGRLEGCVLHCPLHRGSFDARDGEVVTFPTTGGLEADGAYRPTWTPEGATTKPALRPDRLRYYPLRIRDGVIEVAWPA
jgi:nitrite reductase/ring-hydroxylating ferredoxin subunit